MAALFASALVARLPIGINGLAAVLSAATGALVAASRRETLHAAVAPAASA